MTPRVTVVVAARDAADTLGATLASVHAQTFTDWEVVVVDDGSRDATVAVASEAGARVRILSNAHAAGPAAARNRGVREARGDLIATLDADDAWKPQYLESQLAAYEQALAHGRRVGVVCCDADLLGPDGPTGARWSDRVEWVKHIDLKSQLHDNVVFTSVLGPRSVFLELGGYDEDRQLIGLEDYDLWIRILEGGREIVLNDESLAFYRLGEASLSAKVELRATASLETFDRVLRRGALSPTQRRVARRTRRRYEVVRRRARIASGASTLTRIAETMRAAPLVALCVVENPQRWRHWLRNGPRSAGATRHLG